MDVAQLMAAVLILSPAGSYVHYDADAHEYVLVVSDAGWNERRFAEARSARELLKSLNRAAGPDA